MSLQAKEINDLIAFIKEEFRVFSRDTAHIKRIEPAVIEGVPSCISTFSITCIANNDPNNTKESIALYCDKTTAFVSEKQYIGSIVDKILELNKGE